MHRSIAAQILAIPLLLGAGCKPFDAGAGGEAASATVAGSVPAIHARLHWESILGGRNRAREDYQTRLRICQEGGIAVRPLGASEIDKLDTGLVEIKVDARRQVVSQKAWTLGFGEGDSIEASCQFHLQEDAYEDVSEDGGRVPDPVEPAVADAFRGWTALADATVAGQPCRRWRKSTELGAAEEVCVWSGGRELGFEDGPMSNLGCEGVDIGSYLGAIPLEGKPLEGSGCIVKVQSFSIGKGHLPDSDATLTGPEGER